MLKNIKNIFIGKDAIKSIYLGDNLIYENKKTYSFNSGYISVNLKGQREQLSYPVNVEEKNFEYLSEKTKTLKIKEAGRNINYILVNGKWVAMFDFNKYVFDISENGNKLTATFKFRDIALQDKTKNNLATQWLSENPNGYNHIIIEYRLA